MPFTKKGEKIMSNMMKQYGPKKAKNVFYASRNKGTITGVDKTHKKNPKQGKRVNPVLSAAGKKGSMGRHMRKIMRDRK